MTRDEMLADLQYARTLAEEGRHAPLIGGSFSVFFGVLLAICYGAQWALMMRLLPIDESFIGAIWLAFGVCAVLGSVVLSRRVRSLPGGGAIPNRVDRNVWQAVVAAILVVVVGTIPRAIFQGDYMAPNAIVAAGFGLYGVAIYVTATAGGHAWLRPFAILAWIVSGVLWFFLTETWLYLIAAVASAAVLVVPGIIMMQREPKTTV